MGRIRRKFSAEFKAQVAQTVISGQMTQSSAAREHDIGPSLVKKWVEAYSQGHQFADKPTARERQLEAEVKKLQAKVGQLVMDIDLLKKFDTYVQQRKKLATCVVTAKNLDQLRGGVK